MASSELYKTQNLHRREWEKSWGCANSLNLHRTILCMRACGFHFLEQQLMEISCIYAITIEILPSLQLISCQRKLEDYKSDYVNNASLFLSVVALALQAVWQDEQNRNRKCYSHKRLFDLKACLYECGVSEIECWMLLKWLKNPTNVGAVLLPASGHIPPTRVFV